jgi:NADH-quinone oxidoreductase subunit F
MIDAPLTGRARADRRPHSLAEWRALGGYDAVATALALPPAAIIDMVDVAALRGRGGAGFPVATKWRFMPAPGASPGDGPSYLIVNGDEMEPGAFKDRLLLEALPHLVVEGAIIAAHAVHVSEGIILIRDAYRSGIAAIEAAIAEATAAGLLGDNILGSGVSLRLRVHASAGRYIVGE